MNYATVQDIQELKRPLSLDEQSRAAKLIPLICSLIRFEANKVGKDFDQMIVVSELIPTIDVFTGNGAELEFTLSNEPQGSVKVSVDGVEVYEPSYTINGKTLTFAEAPTGEVLCMYDYRALADVAKGVVCDVVMRELNTPGYQLPATSFSENAGSVSQSFSLPNSSGSIKLWPSDLKALGLRRQQLDAIDLRTRKRRGY